MTTLIMNPMPNIRAIALRRFFSITIFPKYWVEEERTSDVINRIIAMTASQRLTSDADNGKFSFINPLWYGTKP
jgi:hypothetical protein